MDYTMKIKSNRKIKMQDKLQMVIEVKEAITFLDPELTTDEVMQKLIFLLGTIADPILLKGLLSSVTKMAEQKAEEVTDLYCNFFSDNETPNNN